MNEKYIRPYTPRPGTWMFRYGKIRKFFRSKEDAIVARDLCLARERLLGAGALLSAAEVHEYRSAKALAGDTPLHRIVSEWRRVFGADGKKAPELAQALDAWRARCERRRLSARTLESYRTAAKRVESAFSGLHLAEISEQRLLKWYFEMPGAARSRRAVLCNALTFLSFCEQERWIERAPKIRRGQLERETPPETGVFSLEETEALLNLVRKKHRAFYPNVALRAFVGLRTAEAAAMRWEWIDFENRRIYVPAEICKTRDAWVLQSPNLPERIFRELAPFRQASGKIPAPSTDYWKNIERGLPFAWKRNGLRHTFCTMHISLCGDASRTATLLKHRGVAMLYRHYCGQLVPQQTAAAYFGERSAK